MNRNPFIVCGVTFVYSMIPIIGLVIIEAFTLITWILVGATVLCVASLLDHNRRCVIAFGIIDAVLVLTLAYLWRLPEAACLLVGNIVAMLADRTSHTHVATAHSTSCIYSPHIYGHGDQRVD